MNGTGVHPNFEFLHKLVVLVNVRFFESPQLSLVIPLMNCRMTLVASWTFDSSRDDGDGDDGGGDDGGGDEVATTTPT